ncbi:MAG: peptidoglycan synthetase [Bacteroidetes bacterium]|nr:MAG: peptidoglycan synthetase [Bacteroidota bacterium]
MKKVHFISIGGAVMHNLALCLHQLGWQVSGSDDEIFEPSLGRLKRVGIAPAEFGWFPDKITNNLDVVILGMHARADNPELLKAKELDLKVYSFPEFVYEHAQDKTRIVIGGSHGKTTTTAMVMHILKERGYAFDYLVGSIIDGYDTMVQLSDAPYIVIEGDEYLNSALDPRPKFHFYHPQMAQLTGIAWDHINVFPTWENYVEQFRIFLNQLPAGAPLAYYNGDQTLTDLCNERSDLNLLPYACPDFVIQNGKTEVIENGSHYPLLIFGKHNLENMAGAIALVEQIGISRVEALQAMQSFKGTARRLELIAETDSFKAYRDFAHSPSKLKATVQSVRTQYPSEKLIAVFELHTFSSLTKAFLDEYHQCLEGADMAIVYFNPEVIAHKKLEALDPEEVCEAFGGDVQVITDSAFLDEYLKAQNYQNSVLLLMSSGNFNNLNFDYLKTI